MRVALTQILEIHVGFFFTLKVSWSFKSSASNFAVLVLTGLKVIRARTVDLLPKSPKMFTKHFTHAGRLELPTMLPSEVLVRE